MVTSTRRLLHADKLSAGETDPVVFDQMANVLDKCRVGTRERLFFGERKLLLEQDVAFIKTLSHLVNSYALRRVGIVAEEVGASASVPRQHRTMDIHNMSRQKLQNIVFQDVSIIETYHKARA